MPLLTCPSCSRSSRDSAKFCPNCGAALARPTGKATDDRIGCLVGGKFRIEALIGEGGMGRVYRATQTTLDKTVVLKVLRSSLMGDARTVARFQREAKAASRLNHPNSISVIDFGQSDDGSLYIALEYVAGEDLHQLLTREGALPQKRICRLAGQVLSALADAHAAGIIHRDLKPENIMVEQRRDEPDFVKVLDFGIAKIQESRGQPAVGQPLTRVGFVCGTPEYMSPEQARGGTLDARSDLYSVGVILYQCATNTLPFDAESPVELVTQHLLLPPTPPRERFPGALINAPMERLILKALEKDPERRPRNAEQFRREIMALEDDELIATRPMQIGLPKIEPASGRSHPGQESARSLAHDERPQANAMRASEPEKPRPWTAAIFLAALAGIVVIGGGAFYSYDNVSRRDGGFALFERPAKAAPADRGVAPELPNEADPEGKRALRARELTARGDAALGANNLDEAVASYVQAFESHPSSIAARRVALAYLLANDSPNATKWFELCVKHANGDADTSLVERYLRTMRTGSP